MPVFSIIACWVPLMPDIPGGEPHRQARISWVSMKEGGGGGPRWSLVWYWWNPISLLALQFEMRTVNTQSCIHLYAHGETQRHLSGDTHWTLQYQHMHLLTTLKSVLNSQMTHLPPKWSYWMEGDRVSMVTLCPTIPNELNAHSKFSKSTLRYGKMLAWPHWLSYSV